MTDRIVHMYDHCKMPLGVVIFAAFYRPAAVPIVYLTALETLVLY